MVKKARESTVIRRLENWVDGQVSECSSDRYGDVFDSATGERCAQVAMSSETDVDKAITAAAEAFPSWSRTPVLRRARIMFKLKELIERDREEIAQLITQEHGKVLHDADGLLADR